ncbi:GNAT family N-acetyltransferase [Lactobacillaceae bacterium Scapto_B20]
MKLCTFNLNNAEVQLVFPEARFAPALYAIIENDRDYLARYLPWADAITSVQAEANFLNYARQKFAESNLFAFVILFNGKPVGMIDLHNLNYDNHSAEVGYWLASAAQGHGIMTNALKQMIINLQPELQLHKITVVADVDNLASRSIPQRLGFHHEAVLVDHIYSNGRYHDADTFIRIFE